MTALKTMGAIVIALIAAACAGPAPDGADLDAEVSRDIVISSVALDVSAIGAQTEGRPVSADTVRSILQATAEETLVGSGGGTRSADVEIEVMSVKLITSGQAIVLGGESIVKGYVRLRDSRTGEVLLRPTKIESGGGGWVLGGLVAAATLDDPRTELRDLSQEFADRTMIVLFGE